MKIIFTSLRQSSLRAPFIFFGMAAALITLGEQGANGDPEQSAPRADVLKICSEIELPPFQAIRADINALKLVDTHAFSADVINEYADAGPTFDDIQKNPKKHDAEFPLRVAVVEAVHSIRKFDKKLLEEIPSPITDQLKQEIERKHQRWIAEMQEMLDDFHDRFLELKKKRKQETSKRWLAHFDYIGAQVLARLVWCSEYNLALGRIRLEQVPDLNKTMNQNGWRLTLNQKMISPKLIREQATEAKAMMAQVAVDYPNTPWAVLAGRQKDMALGLEWQAAIVKKK